MILRSTKQFAVYAVAIFATALALRAEGLRLREPASNQSQNSAATSAPANSSAKIVTFNRDIAPIVFKNCTPCHRPGEAGPFPLLTYEDAQSHARQIVAQTARRYMPPWLPAPSDFAFADEMRLTDEQIAMIRAWYEAGEPRGDAKDLPPTPKFTAGWQLGKPDVILEATKPFALPAGGTDMYWNFVYRSPVSDPRWVQAVEIRPGSKKQVHHANLLVDRSESGRREEAAPGDGFAGMELQIESEQFDPDGHFLFWKPGTLAKPEPSGMALRLDAGNDLVLNTHLQPSGKPELIQPSVGLYFTKQAATEFPVLLQLEGDKQLDIPAGEENFVVHDEFTLPIDVKLLGIYPHAHYLGKDLLAVARLPNGAEKTLIHIPRWDLNWQAVYRYAAPVDLPGGTKIVMRYVYDNSADNLANPNTPPQRVRAGNRASDEMAHLWLQVLPANVAGVNDGQGGGDPRIKLEEAIARHHIENDPDNFAAHYNLGAVLQLRGETQNAVAEFTAAQRLRPGDATVENALGGALLAAGRIREAAAHLSLAVAARSEYFDARYNLGLALARLDDFAGAEEQFGAAVKINPNDANAEANLGSAFAAAGDLPNAKMHLERALILNPQNTLAKENLAVVLQDLPH